MHKKLKILSENLPDPEDLKHLDCWIDTINNKLKVCVHGSIEEIDLNEKSPSGQMDESEPPNGKLTGEPGDASYSPGGVNGSSAVNSDDLPPAELDSDPAIAGEQRPNNAGGTINLRRYDQLRDQNEHLKNVIELQQQELKSGKEHNYRGDYLKLRKMNSELKEENVKLYKLLGEWKNAREKSNQNIDHDGSLISKLRKAEKALDNIIGKKEIEHGRR